MAIIGLMMRVNGMIPMGMVGEILRLEPMLMFVQIHRGLQSVLEKAEIDGVVQTPMVMGGPI